MHQWHCSMSLWWLFPPKTCLLLVRSLFSWCLWPFGASVWDLGSTKKTEKVPLPDKTRSIESEFAKMLIAVFASRLVTCCPRTVPHCRFSEKATLTTPWLGGGGAKCGVGGDGVMTASEFEKALSACCSPAGQLTAAARLCCVLCWTWLSNWGHRTGW